MSNKMKITHADLSILPANLAEYLISPDLTENLVGLANKYGLSGKLDTGRDRYAEFARLVIDTLKGDLPYEEFEDLLKELLKLGDDMAKNLAKDANKSIFVYFINDLKGLYREKQKVADMFIETEGSSVKIDTSLPSKKSRSDSYREIID